MVEFRMLLKTQKCQSFLFVLVFAMCVSAQAKRIAPKPVKPLTNAGLRFEPAYWDLENKGLKQNSGYVRVVNVKNGLPICTKEVYETKYDENLEKDVQDNYITGFKIDQGNLVINSEKLPPIQKPLAGFCD